MVSRPAEKYQNVRVQDLSLSAIYQHVETLTL